MFLSLLWCIAVDLFSFSWVIDVHSRDATTTMACGDRVRIMADLLDQPQISDCHRPACPVVYHTTERKRQHAVVG